MSKYATSEFSALGKPVAIQSTQGEDGNISFEPPIASTDTIKKLYIDKDLDAALKIPLCTPCMLSHISPNVSTTTTYQASTSTTTYTELRESSFGASDTQCHNTKVSCHGREDQISAPNADHLSQGHWRFPDSQERECPADLRVLDKTGTSPITFRSRPRSASFQNVPLRSPRLGSVSLLGSNESSCVRVTPDYKSKGSTYGDEYSGCRTGDPDLHDSDMENDENVGPATEFVVGQLRRTEGILYHQKENPGRRIPLSVLYESTVTKRQAMQALEKPRGMDRLRKKAPRPLDIALISYKKTDVQTVIKGNNTDDSPSRSDDLVRRFNRSLIFHCPPHLEPKSPNRRLLLDMLLGRDK